MQDGAVADPLSMSLDDVIAQSRSKTETSRRGGSSRRGRGAGGVSSRGRRDLRDRSAQRRPSGDLRVQVRNSTNGIQKPVSARSGARGARAFASRSRNEPDEPLHIKQAKLDGDMAWQHDRAPAASAPRPRPVIVAAPVAPRAPIGSSKLIVSNLDQNVSDEDIKELFGSMGDLKQCAINYNRDGVSQGTANVDFMKAADATKAFQEFNGVHLDGKPMHIHQIMLEPDQLSSGLKISRPTGAAAGAASKLGGVFDRAIASAGREPLASSRRGRVLGNAAMDTD